MILTQDFDSDFDTITAGLLPNYSGEPYAFIRFADGETNIMRGRGHRAKSDGWEIRASDESLPHIRDVANELHNALWDDSHGIYLGITAHEHHPDCHNWLMEEMIRSWEQITFAELFIFANSERFTTLDLADCDIVGPHGNISVPADAVMTGWDHRRLVDFLLNCQGNNPVLVSAGPMANIIISDYWRRCPDNRKRVILDVGSALDGKQGRRTRQYHRPDHPQRTWKPRFWPLV